MNLLHRANLPSLVNLTAIINFQYELGYGIVFEEAPPECLQVGAEVEVYTTPYEPEKNFNVICPQPKEKSVPNEINYVAFDPSSYASTSNVFYPGVR